MGRAKQEALEHQGLVEFSTTILINAGTSQRCDDHDLVYADSDDVQAAYKLGNSRWTDPSYNYSDTFRSRREMTDCIKEAYEDNSADGCPSCAHNDAQ